MQGNLHERSRPLPVAGFLRAFKTRMSLITHILTVIALPFMAVTGFFFHSQTIQIVNTPLSIVSSSTQTILISTTTSATSTEKTSIASPTDTHAADVKKVSTPATTSTPSIPKTYTTPNGAVIDSNGKVISPSPQQQSIPAIPASPANSTFCNGTNYSSCPAGENFVCPGDGGTAYCQTPSVAQPQATQSSDPAQIYKDCATENSKAYQEVLQSLAGFATQSQINAMVNNKIASEGYGYCFYLH